MPARTGAENPPVEAAVELVNASGAGPFVLVSEHASHVIPPELKGLGLDDAALRSHIAWDPGALAVAREMSVLLDAPVIAPRFSRLVYDCNRPPEAPSAVAAVSEIYEIPGNSALSDEDRRERATRYYFPFRDALASFLDRRTANGEASVLLTIHSFTPVYKGVRRSLDIGILHDDDSRFADALLSVAGRDGGRVVRRNEPYGPEDGVTHTLKEHALPRGLLNAMVEIRNDLLTEPADQRAMAEWLARVATAALDKWKAENA